MKRLLPVFLALFLGVALTTPFDAEAKRLGGGKSSGMQRQSTPSQSSPSSVPAKQASPTPAPGTPAATPPKRSWMGPLAGLAAGLGIAALLSHFGLGEEAANFLMIALLALAAFMVVRWLINRAKPAAARPMQYAGAGPEVAPHVQDMPHELAGGAAATAPAVAALPPGFDAEAFVRQAKLNFIRLQAANDAGNLDDLREFTSPEMYAEIKLQLAERGNATSKTEVTMLNAEVLEAVEESGRQIVSVRFHGLLREDSPEATPFDEVWHLTRPSNGNGGWVIAGIQQIS
jgi:predicted lipid-binding transport protein (Tim44 family)